MGTVHNEAVHNFYVQVGQNIRKYRKAKGMTQEALAEDLGISRVSVNTIENGKQRLALHWLVKVCDLLGITINKLLP